jgi:hypothetical protein
VVVRCGLEKEKSDTGATNGLIPTHVKEAEQTKKASQGMLVFPWKGFWISDTNILAPALFCFCVFLCCDEVRYGTVWKSGNLLTLR